MSFLFRVELPDVPGSLGRLATAIGEAGGDIEAIEIVEKRFDGTALDDVLLDMEPGVMPDSVVSACNSVEGVRVVWVSRYAAGGNLFLDLEAVEDLTAEPAAAMDRLVHLLPVTFRADWAARVHRVDGIVTSTEAAPADLPFVDIVGTERLEPLEEGSPDVVIAARLGGNDIVVLGRRGGPAFLDSEMARVGHLAGLAVSIARP
ncbi:amino acid-binding protein [Nocardioides sp. GY 10127]|uniref:amino acid-binding protein n=1 Tax=Nocardioides sp. GY 10127 TaxID=2569762 RepID=UPI0010A8AFFA|nr:amino acid-binding protein [Nocardioides sp. GY 10127]TIC82591.1 amino acid-binding protein [Nocardioides sp. GY 10127]